MWAGIDYLEKTKINSRLSRTDPRLSCPNGTVTIPTTLCRQRFETIDTLWTLDINCDKWSVSRFGRFNPDCWKEYGCRSCTDYSPCQESNPSRPICSYSFAKLAAHTTKPSYRNTTDKLVGATVLQSLHSILEKNTNPSSQSDTEWSMYFLLAPPRTRLTRKTIQKLSCQLAFSDYPDWGFPVLFPQL